jgi:hypothetical protein
MKMKDEGRQMEEQKGFSLKRELSVDLISQSNAIKFNWDSKWLKGNEYYHILTHADLYIKLYKFGNYEMKGHPDSIYSNPISKVGVGE